MNHAAVAELADALASGASGSNAIRVRLSSAAQRKRYKNQDTITKQISISK